MKVAVILSGCGVYDGAEIQESVLTLLALDQQGAELQCLAPDMDQMHVIDHLQGETTDETRNVLVEAARIARGQVQPLGDALAGDFDAVVLPGGFGAAKNLCNFATRGADCAVHSEVEEFLLEAHRLQKPLGFLCIAPVIAARLLGPKCENLQLTIGNDPETAAAIQEMGATHVECAANDCVVDAPNRVVSTPAYMSAGNMTELAEGIAKLVAALAQLAE